MKFLDINLITSLSHGRGYIRSRTYTNKWLKFLDILKKYKAKSFKLYLLSQGSYALSSTDIVSYVIFKNKLVVSINEGTLYGSDLAGYVFLIAYIPPMDYDYRFEIISHKGRTFKSDLGTIIIKENTNGY